MKHVNIVKSIFTVVALVAADLEGAEFDDIR